MLLGYRVSGFHSVAAGYNAGVILSLLRTTYNLSLNELFTTHNYKLEYSCLYPDAVMWFYIT